MPVFRLSRSIVFPSAHKAAPDGMLAVGGDLSPERLLRAYSEGIFPWYSEGSPILWWSPDPRLVMDPSGIVISRSLRARIRKGTYRVTFDRAFDSVLSQVASVHARDGTWLVPEMRAAYAELNRLGHAHSVETWHGERLVGGLYGVTVGRLFAGEAMFHTEPDASKVAYVALCKWLAGWNYGLIDCQIRTDHLVSLGAFEMPRARYIEIVRELTAGSPSPDAWADEDAAP